MRKYNYSLREGATLVKTNTKKYAVSALAALTVVGGASGVAMAAKPADPGCFGRDRAAYIQGAQADPSAPGASEVGMILSERGATNGDENRAYKTACGGDSI
jgi:hypothetical protein